MKKFIQSLWTGEYLSEKETAATSVEMRNAERLRARHEEKLLNKLNTEDKELFQKYINCVDEFHDISREEAFIEGIRFAAKLFVEALG